MNLARPVAKGGLVKAQPHVEDFQIKILIQMVAPIRLRIIAMHFRTFKLFPQTSTPIQAANSGASSNFFRHGYKRGFAWIRSII